MNAKIAEATKRLIDAARTGIACAPVRELIGDSDLDLAYEVQAAVARQHEANGHTVVGCKVGLTSAAVQKQFGVFQPDLGLLFDHLVYAHGEPISRSAFIQPRIEAEIAFVLGADIEPAVPSIADIIRATAFVLPALEIVDSRISKWDIAITDTVADNASSGAVVLGTTPRRLDDLDLSALGMVLERNGEEVSFGSGAACLGSPVVAASWVAKELRSRGRALRAGDVILSGALGPMVDVAQSGVFRARIDGLGRVEANITQERS